MFPHGVIWTVFALGKKVEEKSNEITVIPQLLDAIQIKVTERHYYISSLPLEVELFARTVREHWSVEIMHWHLDVTLKNTAIPHWIKQRHRI